MKKLVTILAVVLMVAGFCSVAIAADNQKLAEDYIDANMYLNKYSRNYIEQREPAMKKVWQTDPKRKECSEEDFKWEINLFKEISKDGRSEILNEIKKTFSEDELKTMIALYSSAEQKKWRDYAFKSLEDKNTIEPKLTVEELKKSDEYFASNLGGKEKVFLNKINNKEFEDKLADAQNKKDFMQHIPECINPSNGNVAKPAYKNQ